VYATVPLNVLTWLVFSLAGTKTKIIDVVDIWPDVLPFPMSFRRVLAPIFGVEMVLQVCGSEGRHCDGCLGQFIQEAFITPATGPVNASIWHDAYIGGAEAVDLT